PATAAFASFSASSFERPDIISVLAIFFSPDFVEGFAASAGGVATISVFLLLRSSAFGGAGGSPATAAFASFSASSFERPGIISVLAIFISADFEDGFGGAGGVGAGAAGFCGAIAACARRSASSFERPGSISVFAERISSFFG